MISYKQPVLSRDTIEWYINGVLAQVFPAVNMKSALVAYSLSGPCTKVCPVSIEKSGIMNSPIYGDAVINVSVVKRLLGNKFDITIEYNTKHKEAAQRLATSLRDGINVQRMGEWKPTKTKFSILMQEVL